MAQIGIDVHKKKTLMCIRAEGGRLRSSSSALFEVRLYVCFPAMCNLPRRGRQQKRGKGGRCLRPPFNVRTGFGGS